MNRDSKHKLSTSIAMLGLLTLSLLISSLACAQDVERRISMTMKDADLADVMDMISREQRVNIFVSTDSTSRSHSVSTT